LYGATPTFLDWPRYSAVLAIILLFSEALLGARLVVLNHAAQDQSAAHALLLCLHFGNTLLLLASLSLTARWLSSEASADLLLEIRSCQSVVKSKRAIELERIPASLAPDSLSPFIRINRLPDS
jgi:heme A synthase